MKNQVVKQIDGILLNSFKVVAGWIQFTISTESQNVYQQYSHIYDPLMDLKKWLEAICNGVEQCSFSFNPEGVITKYDFKIIYDNSKYGSLEMGIFKIIDDEDGYNEQYLRTTITLSKLVNGFYQGFMNLVSRGYDSLEWDHINMVNNLGKLFGLNEKELIEFLLELNWKDFNKALYISDRLLNYTNTFSGRNIDILYKTYYDIEGKDLKGMDEENFWIEASYLREKDRYDSWPQDKKLNYIKRCIYSSLSPYDGDPVHDIKSDIIENYLALQGYEVCSIKN